MTASPTNGVIRGILFDLDGTLYTLAAMKLRMTLRLWKSIGFLRHLSTSRNRVRGSVYKDSEALLHEFYEHLAHACGSTPESAKNWYQGDFRRAFLQMLKKSARLRHGVDEMLRVLKQKGIRTAVLSDFGWVKERLDAIGIDYSLFDTIASTESFGALKPSSVSLLALAENWRIDPADVLVVGDRADMDQAAAAAAGMQFMAVSELRGDPQGKAGSWQQILDRTSVKTNAE